MRKKKSNERVTKAITIVLSVLCVIVLFLIIICIITFWRDYKKAQSHVSSTTEGITQNSETSTELLPENVTEDQLLNTVDKELAERVAATFVESINSGDVEMLLVLLPESLRDSKEIQDAINTKVEDNVKQEIEIDSESLKCVAGSLYTTEWAKKYNVDAFSDVVVTYNFETGGKLYNKSEIITVGRIGENWYYFETQDENVKER